MTTPHRDEDLSPPIFPIGRAICQRREALGLSQAELAERLGPDTTPRAIAWIESGRILFPSWIRLLCLAEALDCSVKDLLNGAGTDDVPS